MAIKGVHALSYTTEPEAAREFLRDKLGLPAYDSGGGWLIFAPPEGDIGCRYSDRPFHGISFYCDDIDATISELSSRGVEFKSPLREEEWGRVTEFELPGGSQVESYEPKYTKPQT
jgi:catechol 2,3-dioxygenase-like lactoylglutathione lyase family enzyme